MAPKLEKCFVMRAYISKDHSHGLNPARSIVPIISGFIEGSGLKAEIIPGGGDWISVGCAFSMYIVSDI